MQQNTHLKTSNTLVGTVISIEENKAIVQLKMTQEMAVDAKGLAHGGFTFGLADYAAMVATNHPNVVLGKAEVKFIKPTVVGDLLTAEAVVSEKVNPVKSAVSVAVKNQNDVVVFEGEFICFSLNNHVLQK
jgi:acyl-coenzyme A thioesterase PaaI-like protein